jgi:acylphosphatase
VKSIEILISGKVQKVGFRSCIKRIAWRLNIKGEVMNQPDGTVRIRASGDWIILEKFISMIYGCPRAVIRDVTINELDLREYDDFIIRRIHE